jgi:predicted nucleotidyltransferase
LFTEKIELEQIKETEGRRAILKALYGSDNYNLKTPESDKDYKLFTVPSFNDLYDNKIFLKSVITPEEDMQIADIRKLPTYLFKSNINWIEILYSKEIICHPDLKEIFDMREKVVAMNIQHLYYACLGDHFTKMSRLHHPTESTAYLMAKYKYNTKEALYAYRALDFIQRFYAHDFKEFDKVIRYEDGVDRDFMLGIKHGAFSEEQFMVMMEEKLANTRPLEGEYKKFNPDVETKDKLESIIKEFVRNNMTLK